VRAAAASSAVVTPATTYLLFSGPLDRLDVPHGRPIGFACEESARLAFVQIRLRPSSQAQWAELLAVHADEKPKTLCWFGTPTSQADHLVRTATAWTSSPADRRWRWPAKDRRRGPTQRVGRRALEQAPVKGETR
jgi:hypothetical protein